MYERSGTVAGMFGFRESTARPLFLDPAIGEPALIRTCVIEAMLAAVVITVSAARRRHRRMRRTAAARA